MKNYFRCYKCGVLNIHGLSTCSRCGAPFQYFCPACGVQIEPVSSACQNCGSPLHWPFEKEDEQSQDDKGAEREKVSAPSWILPTVLSLVVFIVAAGIFTFAQMVQSPQQPVTNIVAPSSQTQSENTTAYRVPPKIRDIVVDNLSLTTVDIRWVTDKPSSSQVMWSQEGEYAQTSVQKEALVTQHEIQLSDLKVNTIYLFKVRSVDQYGNEAVSDQIAFNVGSPYGKNSVIVLTHSMVVDEQPKPVGTRTYIRGMVKNIGDLPISVRDVRVTISFKVAEAGKTSAGQVVATLDASPEKISSGETHNFSALVPNNSLPDYTVEVEVLRSL